LGCWVFPFEGIDRPHPSLDEMIGMATVARLTLCALPVVLTLLWPFFYVAAPTSTNCWIVPPGHTTEIGVGLQSTLLTEFAPESDANFGPLYTWYIFATAASAVGAAFSFSLYQKILSVGQYGSGQQKYNAYVRALCAYFAIQLLINFITCIAFIENRCHFHNIDMSRYDDTKCTSGGGGTMRDCCASNEWHESATCSDGYTPFPAQPPASDCRYTCLPPPGANVTLPDVYSASTAGSYFVRIMYLMTPVPGGVLTNMILELVLTRKARMLEGVASCARFLRGMGRLVVVQLLCMLAFIIFYGFVVSSVVVYDHLHIKTATDEKGQRVVAVDSSRTTSSPVDTNHDGIVSPEEELTLQGEAGLTLLGALHTLVSLALMAVFIYLLLKMTAKQRARALPSGPNDAQSRTMDAAGANEHALQVPPMPSAKQGELDTSTLLIVRRVTVCTLISVLSTLLTYSNFLACFANWYMMLALDSIVNDVCMLYSAYTGEVDDAANAQDAQLAADARERREEARKREATRAAGAQEQQIGIAMRSLDTISCTSSGAGATPIMSTITPITVASADQV